MGIFRKASSGSDDNPNMDGVIVARITVDRINRQQSKVKAYAVERSTGKTVFKVRYETSNKSETSCYYDADNMLRSFASDNDYVIDGKVMSNIDLPTVRTLSNKRMR